MKIAIFTDIHGNKEALTAIIEDIKKENIDEIICLGDTIGIGPNSKECVDILIDNNVKSVLGNHDLYFTKGIEIDDEMSESEKNHHLWVNEQLGEREKEYLDNLPMTIEKEFNGKKVLFVHFPIDYNSKDEYPFCDLKILEDESIINVMESLNYDLIFIGHEHKAFTIDNKLYDIGTSGCTKDDMTKYAILDTDTFEVNIKNIEYDRDKFKEELYKIDYPDRDNLAKWGFGIDL